MDSSWVHGTDPTKFHANGSDRKREKEAMNGRGCGRELTGVENRGHESMGVEVES